MALEIREELHQLGQFHVLENRHLTVSVLPSLGGKIVSLFDKAVSFELAAQTGRGYASPAFGHDFSLYDASGLDDCFPCLHPGYDEPSRLNYPNHGEIWSAAMQAEIRNDTLHLYYHSPHFPYRYAKSLSLCQRRLVFHYRIEHTGSAPMPCIWAFHGLFRYQEDMRLFYPEGAQRFLCVLDSPSPGLAGSHHGLNGSHDFTRVPPKQPPSMAKYYLDGKAAQGRCGYLYPSAGLRCTLHYDAAVLPYLGV